jgi:hypothetical protein
VKIIGNKNRRTKPVGGKIGNKVCGKRKVKPAKVEKIPKEKV